MQLQIQNANANSTCTGLGKTKEFLGNIGIKEWMEGGDPIHKNFYFVKDR